MPLTYTLQAQVSNSLPSYSDKVLLPQSVLSSIIDKYPTLPHPLIFKVISHEPGLRRITTYVGVKEFTLEEEIVGLPRTIYDRLKLGLNGQQQNLELELMDNVPKCTLLKLKPRFFYSEVHNWKFFLEDKLVKNYTILTEGELLFIEYNDLRIEFTIEEMNTKVCSIVDTDIVLEVVPLDDETAAKQLEFNKQEGEIEITSSRTVIDNLKPLLGNVPEKARVFKFDLSKVRGSKLVIHLENSHSDLDDDINSLVNIDLICGLDKFVGLENFLFTTMDEDFKLLKMNKEEVHSKHISIDLNSDLIRNKLAKKSHEDDSIFDKFIYLVAFCWEKSTSVVLTVLEDDNDDSIVDIVPEQGTKQCSNCQKYIPESTYAIHEAFCLRNNKRCTCGEVFLKKIPETHWHCPDDETYGNGLLLRFKHQRMHHHVYHCCDIQFKSFIDMVTTHKATVCPLKFHECKFCHLVLPQGEATYKDRFENLTNHENNCGNRTTECYTCNKVFRLKDLPKHLEMHEVEKRERLTSHKINFLKCSNVNCIRLLDIYNTNELLLCEVCYGPLYMAQHDPAHMKLQGRIERRYVMQLTRGCGNLWCTNKYCATANKSVFGAMGMRQKLETVNKELLSEVKVPALPINKDQVRSGGDGANTFWFCVSETILTKKVLIEMLTSEGEYDMEIIYKAANESSSNENDIRTWLGLNGVRHKNTEGH